MAEAYLIISAMFVTKALLVYLVGGLLIWLAWTQRCLVLKHKWTWRTRDHACGQRAGTMHLVSCDRCGRSHLKYLPWLEQRPEGVTITKPSAGLASAIQKARGGPKPPIMQRGFA